MVEPYKERNSKANFVLYSAIAEMHAANAGFGDVRIAESKLLSVLKLKPIREELAETHNLLAQLYAQTKRLTKVIDHFKAALAIAPEQTILLTINLAELLEKRKKWELAIEVYTLGLTGCEDASLYQGMAYCLSKTGNLEEAEYHARKASELAPDDAACANDLGFLLMERGKNAQAKICFESALRIDPAYKLAMSNLALCTQRISGESNKIKNKYTPKQGQYLIFIYNYTKIHGVPPAEAELERYFKVACSSVHQMILTLEKRGLITRTPGVARSIRVLLPYQQLPELK